MLFYLCHKQIRQDSSATQDHHQIGRGNPCLRTAQSLSRNLTKHSLTASALSQWTHCSGHNKIAKQKDGGLMRIGETDGAYMIRIQLSHNTVGHKITRRLCQLFSQKFVPHSPQHHNLEENIDQAGPLRVKDKNDGPRCLLYILTDTLHELCRLCPLTLHQGIYDKVSGLLLPSGAESRAIDRDPELTDTRR